MKKIRSIFSFLQRNKRPQKQKNLFQHTGRRVVPLSLRLGAAALALCLFAGIGLTAYPLMASAAQAESSSAVSSEAVPEATTAPEATATPEATTAPEVTATPEATATPQVTQTPAPTAAPTATAALGAALFADPTAEPTATPTATPEVTATPTPAPQEVDLSAYLTSKSIKINGTELNAGSTLSVQYGDPFAIQLAWQLDNQDTFTTNDVFYYTLPDNLDLVFSTSATGDVLDSTSTAVGTYAIDSANHRINIHYNESVFQNNSGNIAGTMYLAGSIVHDAGSGQNGGTITVTFPGVGTFPLDIERDDSADTLSVQKSAPVQSPTDPQQYTFVVKVQASGPQQNVVITDTMGSYLTYLDGSIAYFTDEALTTPYAGTAPTFATLTEGNGFTTTFGQLGGTDATGNATQETVYLRYTAILNADAVFNINNSSARTNTVTAKSDNRTPPSSSSTVTLDKTWLTKSNTTHRDADTYAASIDWSVYVNLGTTAASLDGMTLTDWFDTQDLPDISGLDSVVVSMYQLPGGSVTQSTAAAADWGTPTTLTWAQFASYAFGDTTNAYKFTYTTQVKDNDNLVQDSYKNNVKLENGTGTVGSTSSTGNIGTNFVYITKSTSDARVVIEKLQKDPVTGTPLLHWTSKVNVPYNWAGGDITFTDTLGTGHTLKSDSIVIQRGTDIINPTLSTTAGGFSFTIASPQPNDVYTITYTTVMDTTPTSAGSYQNTSKIEAGTLTKQAGATYTVQFLQGPLAAKTLMNDSEKQYGLFRWGLQLKYYGNDLTGTNNYLDQNPDGSYPTVTIVDTLQKDATHNGQLYLAGSAMLVRNTGDATGVALPDPTVTTLPDGSTQLTFTVTDEDVASFKDANGKVWTFYLVYKTQTEDLFAENAHQTFKNTATVVGFEKNQKSAETTTDLAKLVDKNFVYANPPFVEYTVKVNQAGLDLVEGKDTLTLVDTMGEAIAYLPGTAQYTLASGGASVPLSPSFDPVAHTLTFTVPDSTALTLIYKTKVTLTPGVSFGELGRNSITLTGVVTDRNGDEVKLEGDVKMITAGVISENYYLEVYKHDTDDTSLLLPGTKFDVYKMVQQPDGSYLTAEKVTTGTTDSYGVFKALDCKPGIVYALIETAAAPGYQLDTTPYYFVKDDGNYTAVSNITVSGTEAALKVYSQDTAFPIAYLANTKTPAATPTPVPTPTATPTQTPVVTPTPTPTTPTTVYVVPTPTPTPSAPTPAAPVVPTPTPRPYPALVMFEDNRIPLGRLPQTGKENLKVWVTAAAGVLLAGGGAVGLLWDKKRRNSEKGAGHEA